MHLDVGGLHAARPPTDLPVARPAAVRTAAKQPMTGERVEEAYILANGMVDYYALLNVEDTATFQEIKAA